MQRGILRAGGVLGLAVLCFALAGAEFRCTAQNAVDRAIRLYTMCVAAVGTR
jgi:hypothetical protein